MESESEFRMPFNRNRSRSGSESWCRPHYSYVRLRDYVPTMIILLHLRACTIPCTFIQTIFKWCGLSNLKLPSYSCPLLTDLVLDNPEEQQMQHHSTQIRYMSSLVTQLTVTWYKRTGHVHSARVSALPGLWTLDSMD